METMPSVSDVSGGGVQAGCLVTVQPSTPQAELSKTAVGDSFL